MPTPTAMAGPRSWNYTTGGQSVGMANTDFQVLYSADIGNGVPVMKMTLKKVWEHSDFSQYGMDRLKYMEERLSVLATSDLVGTSGTLTIDGVSVVMPMKFMGVTLDGSDAPNELIVYTVEFQRAMAGAQLGRNLFFGDGDLMGREQNFFITFAADDRTTFPEPYRAAPLMMRNGPAKQYLTVTGIYQMVNGSNPRQRQLHVEQAAGSLLWIQKGKSALLNLDGRDVGLCYLKDVVIKETLPNALLIELQFITGYAEA